MKRTVVEGAERCPFCGQGKIFLKKVVQGVHQKRYALSLQCSSSKCCVNGPQVFTDWVKNGRGYSDKLDAIVTQELISKAIERWNTRFAAVH